MNLSRLSGTQSLALVTGVVIVVVVLLLISSGTFDLGGGDDADPLEATASEQTAEASEPSDDEPASEVASTASGPAALGEALQFGDLRLVIESVERLSSAGEGSGEIVARERFALVRLRARNSGRTPIQLDEGSLRLVDSRGRQFAPNRAATAEAARRDETRLSALETTLPPDLNSDLLVIFDVTDDATGLRLRILRGFVEVALE